jgi:hypothetical protein
MSRLTLPILAALASSMALSTLAASAQVELAALDASASSSSSGSSSSSSAMFASSAQAAPAMTMKSSEGGGGPFSGIGVAVKFGLAGVGFDVATPLVPGRLNLRGGR